MDVNLTPHGHLTVYPNIKSLCCTPETNKMYVNYTFIQKELLKLVEIMTECILSLLKPSKV